MLKKFFKSSVSTFVLLGTLTTFTPSYAMEKEDEIKKTPLLLSSQNFKNEENKNHGLVGVSKDIAQNIFLYLNPPDLWAVGRVCQIWFKMSIEDQGFLKVFYEKYKEKFSNTQNQSDPETLIYLISRSPRLIPLVDEHFDQLALLCPSSFISYEQEAKFADAPLNLKNFATIVEALPNYHPHFEEKIVSLDPLDFQKTAFAFYVIKEGPLNKTRLENRIKDSIVDLNNFENLVQNPQNHSAFKKHLMALKLLVLSGDKNANTKMMKFATDILNPLLYNTKIHIAKILIEKSMVEIIHAYINSEGNLNSLEEVKFNLASIEEKYIPFVNQSFWSAYTNDRLTYILECEVAKYLPYTTLAPSLNTQAYKKFANYARVMASLAIDFDLSNIATEVYYIKYETSLSTRLETIPFYLDILRKIGLEEKKTTAAFKDEVIYEFLLNKFDFLEKFIKELGL